MGRFVTKSDVKVIRADWWDEGEEVTIRKYTIRQKDLLDAKIIEIAGMAGEIPQVVVKSVAVPYLIAGIAEWTFTDEEGNRVPVNRHWIDKLDEDTADFIADEIRNFNEGRTTAEQREFLRKLADSDNDERETPA